MSRQHTCERCNVFITQNEAGVWLDGSGVMAGWCRYGHPDETNNPDIPHVPAEMKSSCTFCKREIKHISGVVWHSDEPVLAQYCYVDPSEGSRLHTPA